MFAMQVGGRDTLTSVAARFDTTPSELTSINKLNSSFIYPGQQLLVPDKATAVDANDDGGDGVSSSPSGKSSPTEDKARKISTDESEQDSKEKGMHFSRLLPHIRSIHSPSHPQRARFIEAPL